MKKFRAIVICGKKGAGKSTLVKKFSRAYKGHKFILDPRMEHPGGIIMPFEDFTKRARNIRNSMIIIEEATMFLSNKGDNEDLKWILISLRHDANTIIFVFHSMQSIPLNILSQCDVLFLFHTKDNVRLVENKFSQNVGVFEGFVEINESLDEHAYKAIIL